jgi:hypothetical protein
MREISIENRANRPEQREKIGEATIHNRANCRGFGSVLAKPEITHFLGVSLRQSGFEIREVVIGISDKLKFGSKRCPDCTTWLRTE